MNERTQERFAVRLKVNDKVVAKGKATRGFLEAVLQGGEGSMSLVETPGMDGDPEVTVEIELIEGDANAEVVQRQGP